LDWGSLDDLYGNDGITVDGEMSQAEMFRDEAIARVEANSQGWVAQALLAIRAVPSGWRGTAEALRLQLLTQGLPSPHHHNCWGALIMTAVKKNLLCKTGKMEHMKTKKSHARLTPEYKRGK
jgi:hypothetical protein